SAQNRAKPQEPVPRRAPAARPRATDGRSRRGWRRGPSGSAGREGRAPATRTAARNLPRARAYTWRRTGWLLWGSYAYLGANPSTYKWKEGGLIPGTRRG